MENIKLTNGFYLHRAYGKYNPNLTIVYDKPIDKDFYYIFKWVRHPQDMFNANFDGEVWILKGQYRKNKKGTDIFDLTKNGDVLIRVNWGGSSRKYFGFGDVNKDTKGVKYYRRASSNGGGLGYTYIIVPDGWKLELSEDDI